MSSIVDMLGTAYPLKVEPPKLPASVAMLADRLGLTRLALGLLAARIIADA
jgi:hypothetical protein